MLLSTPKTEYRERLIAARERLGLTRSEMAARLLTPRATYEQWELGKRRTPGIAIIAAERISPHRRGDTRAKILALADGTMSIADISASVGVSLSYAYTVIVRAGAPYLRGRRGAPRGERREQSTRNQEIIAAVAAGESYRSIASRYEVTFQRVQQIAKRNGARSVWKTQVEERRQARETQRAAELAERAEREEKLRALVIGGRSIRSAGAELGYTRGQLQTLTKQLQLGEATQHGRWNHRTR